MIENYSPSMDAHAKDDGGTLRKGVPWQTMVNCDGSYTLEENLTPHKAPRVMQTLLWISTIAAGTAHQLIFAGEAPQPMGQQPWGGAGSHPERTFWGSKGGMRKCSSMPQKTPQKEASKRSLKRCVCPVQPCTLAWRCTRHKCASSCRAFRRRSDCRSRM